MIDKNALDIIDSVDSYLEWYNLFGVGLISMICILRRFLKND